MRSLVSGQFMHNNWSYKSCKVHSFSLFFSLRVLAFASKKDLQFERVDSIVKCKTNFSIDLLQFWPILILSIRELDKIKKEMHFKVIVYRDAKWQKQWKVKLSVQEKRDIALSGYWAITNRMTHLRCISAYCCDLMSGELAIEHTTLGGRHQDSRTVFFCFI